MCDLAKHIKDAHTIDQEENNKDIHGRLEHVKNIRHWYTYKGVIEQIDKFFQDPLGKYEGWLCTCTIHSIS